ncbi:uncharacterized protein [Amphiura filiformis]|uniref:uncharacterized protein n=1 Tax=Amphiura filiformis TaxID=82378 RepID=UPI003B228BE3
MPLCRVFHCKTNTGQTDIPCHRFPAKDLETSRRWLIACKIQWEGSLKNYKFRNKIVCGLHFAPSDYEDDTYSKVMLADGKIEKARPKRLKPGVVPTLNLTKLSDPKPRLISQQRAVRQEKEAQKRTVNSKKQSHGKYPGKQEQCQPPVEELPLPEQPTKGNDHEYCIPTPKRPSAKPLHTPAPTKPRRIEYKEDAEDEEEVPVKPGKKDTDYEPSSSSSSSDEECSTEELIREIINDSKYIVFNSCLRSLIGQCRCHCGSVLLIYDHVDKYSEEKSELGSLKGSMLTVKTTCLKGHPWEWSSQPLIGEGKEAVPAGNLMLSAAMLFSGTSFAKASHMASFMNLRFISEGTKIGHEGSFIFPVVHESWYHEKHTLWRSLEGTPVRGCGDARCDTPGYCAKYCTYVMMEMDTGKILDIETLSVNEASSSNAMEKEACHRLLDRLKENDVELSIFCTDRHASIAKMMREEYADIDHQFDMWHLAKSVTKKLHAKARQKECQELNPWISSIKNHLWWAAASCNGNSIELTEKWRSVVHHVVDRHDWGGSQQYHQCVHDPLPPEEREAKKWLEEGSEAHEALGKVINDNTLLKGINKVNLFCHTGKTEVFNSSLLKFAPKRSNFGYEGMVVRTKLAAIENNMNTGRVQARVQHETKHSGPAGSLRYKVVYPKAKKDWVAKPIYEGKEYGYVYDLIEDVLLRKLAKKKGTDKKFFDPPAKALEKNIAGAENPGKAVVIAAHQSRFGTGDQLGHPIGS